MHEKISDTKGFFLDMLYLFGVFLSSGYSIPPEYVCDRDRYHEFMREQREYEARKALYEMKRQEYLKVKEKGNFVLLELTKKGRVEAIKQKVLGTKEFLPKDQACLISFDIPENVKKTRNAFRSFIKKAGFKQEHLSVWINRLNVVEGMRELVCELKIEKWVKIYKAEL
jgi:DNA-binding transcriptional regulator PaaX